MKVFLPVMVLCAVISIYTGCKKDSNSGSQPNNPNKEVKIGSQTLAETKATFQGRWKLNYTLGGITGNIKVAYPNTILQFTTTDSLYRWDNNIQTIYSRVSYNYSSVYIDNYSTYILNIETPRNMMDYLQTAYAKKGDTLIMVETEHTNPDRYYLTRQ